MLHCCDFIFRAKLLGYKYLYKSASTFLKPNYIYNCSRTFIILHSSFSTMVSSDSQNALNCLNNNIVKSASDLREYRGMELKNKLKVMLVSDPLTDKAAASMDINIGSLCDPDHVLGLAHFCEHMLFLGTSKYPNEDEYSKFISQHAGSSNAFTSSENTNYYFDIGHEHLHEILDRFAQFFIAPLFDASCTDRELNAVHSEHEKNLMSDGWRLRQLEKSTTDPNHQFSKFSTGNKETLDTIPKSNNISVRDELLQFHQKYYSSNLMSLTVLGKESLDDLQDMVVKLFTDIENKNISPLSFDTSPYRTEDLQKFVYVVPVKDVRNLILKFPIPDCRHMYKTSPAGYLAHLIGHEGPGSLLSELKKQGWVNALMAGDEEEARGFGTFVIQVDLTKAGLEHIDDILTNMFQYINMLRKNEVQEWIFNEINEINSLNFRFKDKQRPSSYVTNVASALHDYPLEDVLTAGILLSEFRPNLIDAILEKLVPTNFRVYAVAKEFDAVVTNHEKWYGTEYHVKTFPDELVGRLSETQEGNPRFHLPLRNEFIPQRFEIPLLSIKHSSIPTLIKSEKLSKLWFKQDDQFKLPKTCLMFELFSPIAYAEPQSANMVFMFTEVFKDSLNEYAYSAELAGLKYSLKNSTYGLQVEIKGYNDKQRVLVEKIFKRMADFKVDPQRFEIIKELYLRVLKNFTADQPYLQAMYFTHAIKSERAWLKTDLLAALPSLTCDALQEFTQQFMSRLHVNMFMHGSLLGEDASNLSSLVEDIFSQNAATVPLASSQLSRYREVCIPKGSSYVYQYQNTVRDISAVDLFLQIGIQNMKENVLLKLFQQVINEPCFNVLRTRENLGYIVASGVVLNNSVQGLRVIVQSERTPDYLEQRIEAFLNHIKVLLNEMTADEYQSHVNAIMTLILEKPKKLGTEARKHWIEILSEQYQFKRPETEAECLRTITKDDLEKFYDDYIHINGPERSKLIVHVMAKSVNGCPTTPLPTQNDDLNNDFYPCPPIPESKVITNFTDFKESLSLYPRYSPEVENLNSALRSPL